MSRETQNLMREWLKTHRAEAMRTPNYAIAKMFHVLRKNVAVARRELGLPVWQPTDQFLRAYPERLIDFVHINPDSGCWEWKGWRYDTGYGRIGRAGYAHIFSFKINHGPIPQGMWCLHTCDNPCCVNPAHLYAGTPKRNAEDRGDRTEWVKPRLSSTDVLAIRERIAAGDDIRRIAKDYHRHVAAIQRIKWGKTYKDRLCA